MPPTLLNLCCDCASSAQELGGPPRRHVPRGVQSSQPAKGTAGQRLPGPAGARRGPVPVTQEGARQGPASLW